MVLCLVRLWLRSHLGAWGASGRQGTRAYCRYRFCCLGALSSLLIDHHFRKNNFDIFALIAAIGSNSSLALYPCLTYTYSAKLTFKDASINA